MWHDGARGKGAFVTRAAVRGRLPRIRSCIASVVAGPILPAREEVWTPARDRSRGRAGVRHAVRRAVARVEDALLGRRAGTSREPVPGTVADVPALVVRRAAVGDGGTLRTVPVVVL